MAADKTTHRVTIMKHDVPLEKMLAEQLFAFWESIFPDAPDVTHDVYLGSENEHNHCTVFSKNRDELVVATCSTLQPRALSRLGSLGEVATDPKYRGQGLATELCSEALNEFRARSGEVIFLGTRFNPTAFRIYHRLGWQRLTCSTVMANITSGESPEAFLVEHFRATGQVTIHKATPSLRVPIIPLLLAPHDWQVLDTNAAMVSTRHEIQISCNGLYRRYLAAVGGDQGQWFAARTDDGRCVGLSTARLLNDGTCQVDGFTHHRFLTCWSELIQAAIDWGELHAANGCCAVLSVEDDEKLEFFQSLGFKQGKPCEDFEIAGRKIAAVKLERG